jgi:hypothetical protein
LRFGAALGRNVFKLFDCLDTFCGGQDPKGAAKASDCPHDGGRLDGIGQLNERSILILSNGKLRR